jgi:hypothetical protein
MSYPDILHNHGAKDRLLPQTHRISPGTVKALIAAHV